VEGRGQVYDQGLDVAHMMLNRQHCDALRHEIGDHEVLPHHNHQKRSRAVLPQTPLVRVGGGNAHNRIQVGEIAVGNVIAAFPA